MKKLTSLTIAASLASMALLQAEDADNLFPEGNFEGEINLTNPFPNPAPMDMQQGEFYIEPGDFKNKGCKISVENENGSNFIRYKAPAGFSGILRTYIALDLPNPPPPALTISMRWRTSNTEIPEGAPEWASAQNDPMFVFEDGTNKTIYGTLRLKGDTGGGWVEVEKTVNVPDGAKRLVLQPGLYGMTGTLDVDDIKVFAE